MSLVSSLPIRFVVCFAVSCVTSTTVVAEGAGTKNVLLLCIDDLRPVLGCYGGQAKTPHLDHLAKSATVFTRHYVQWPVCGPSRASMLGGLRPDTTGIYELGDSWKISKRPETHPTLPRYFRDHGYRTLSFGKVYHGRGNGDGYGWSEDPWKLDWSCYVDFPYESKKKGQWRPAIEIYDGPETEHNDYQTADHVIRAVKANKDRSFFIAGGFYKPHLPLVVPRRYWDEYSAEQVQLLMPRRRAQGAAEFMYNWTEIASYGLREGILFSDDSNVDEQAAHRMTRAYYACVSFIDAQIGRILETLDENGLSDTTAVVIWSDHGFHLGDHGRWAKHTQFEQAMRSPLIVRLTGASDVDGNNRSDRRIRGHLSDAVRVRRTHVAGVSYKAKA